MTVHYLTKRPHTHSPDSEDPQAHRVYRLEAAIDGMTVDHVCPKVVLEKVIKTACRTWKVKPPKLVLVNHKYADWNGIHTDGVITLNRARCGQNLMTLLHELAHHIVKVRGYAIADHDREWVWIYIELLEHFNVMPRECMLLLCKKYQVEVG